ncbi:MAG: cysteine-rich CWC family protein [Spongiibacteraceae bacterium]
MTNNFESVDFKNADSVTTAEAQRCPGCGARNDCAIARGEQQCWCMVEPIGIALPSASNSADARCYCQDCLRALSSSKNQN